jgi:hypothetical protein
MSELYKEPSCLSFYLGLCEIIIGLSISAAPELKKDLELTASRNNNKQILHHVLVCASSYFLDFFIPLATAACLLAHAALHRFETCPRHPRHNIVATDRDAN